MLPILNNNKTVLYTKVQKNSNLIYGFTVKFQKKLDYLDYLDILDLLDKLEKS